MQDRDWTGTAAAVTALALSAGVWLWPDDTPRGTIDPAPRHSAMDDRSGEDLARWRAEARRWDGIADAVQLSAAGSGETAPAFIR